MIKHIKCAVSAASILSGMPALAQEVSCAKLDQIAAASVDKFRSVSAPDPNNEPDDDDVVATVFLPGAKQCSVDTEYARFSCTFQTGATVEGSTTWGTGHLAYVVEQFQKWFAGCAGYSGDPRFMYQHTISYKGQYSIKLDMSLYWDTGRFIATLRPSENR